MRAASGRLPDFIIIGAMKSATSTLHDQLALQPGIFMSTPKEPNYFSDQAQWDKGENWYRGLFATAAEGALCGESSTHYSKLPDHEETLPRLHALLPNVRLIYVMRDPFERLVSHYIHEWTQRQINTPIDHAIQRFPELINYGRYAMQLEPYLRCYGGERVLPVFFERLVARPQRELERVCHFLGYDARQPVWCHDDAGQRNASSERLRHSAVRNLLLENPPARLLRQKFVPQSWRDRIKSLWQMKDRPELSPSAREALRASFDEDLQILGDWLGVDLDSGSYSAVIGSDQALEWKRAPSPD